MLIALSTSNEHISTHNSFTVREKYLDSDTWVYVRVHRGGHSFANQYLRQSQA